MQISLLRRFLERLGPYQSLLVLAVPLAIAMKCPSPTTTLVMIGAYAGSLFVTERLFGVRP